MTARARTFRPSSALVLCAGALLLALPLAAEELPVVEESAEPPAAAPAKLRVGVSPFAPFILVEGEPRGFSIDLWKRVAEKMRVDFELVSYAGVDEKLKKLEEGHVDVAIGGITFTPEREAALDFTHPVHESGLSILVRADDEMSAFDKLALALSSSKLGIILGFLLLIVVAGHLIWLAERGADAFSDQYKRGVLEGMYWAIVTASTVGYGDKAPVRWTGRLLAGLLIVISLPMFALFTAELTSALTVNQINSRIQGPQDLPKVRVGVLRGTVSAKWVTGRGLKATRFDAIDAAYAALAAEEIDAVVYDAPSLMYYAQTAGRGQVQVAGSVFAPQDLGMAVREGSPLRERINLALLQLMEEGEVARLKADWFGRS